MKNRQKCETNHFNVSAALNVIQKEKDVERRAKKTGNVIK